MRIKNIKLNNFKFHKDLEFGIVKENCLIYGENGVGKSSIYWGLYSLFHRDLIDTNKYKTYGSTTPMKVEIELDDSSILDTNTESSLINDNIHTIYFAHQDFLEEITIKNNFYEVIEDSLTNHFPLLNSYIKEFDRINSDIDETNNEEEVGKRIINIENFSNLLEELTQKANNIIQNSLNENFFISFDINWGMSQLANSGKYSFSKPQISIKIDYKDNLRLNFNEAKLKLTSLAIFFSLIKEEESDLKLLVLDDFLTSLDMANRKLIVQYILDNFGEYQKIILTHNIQFYNLIIRLLKLRKKDDEKEELTDWDIKRLFLSNISDDPISEIKSEKSFLEQAKDRLIAGDLPSSGNLLRKEFERIVHEFEMLLELGKVEDMSNILDVLKEPKLYYSDPHKTIISFITTLEKFISLEKADGTPLSSDIKLSKIEKEIEKLKTSKIDLSRAETSEDGTVQHSLLLSLQKTNFYNGIILNPLSHDDEEKEIYRKECLNIIELLSSLDIGLKKLKGNSYT